jgi:diadenosine tetraphosphatase ApaH/serine/threonine PP2A family protein phosphatase
MTMASIKSMPEEVIESPRKRSRGKSGTRESTTSNNNGSTIVAITDKQTKSLLRERDSKIAALEKEVIGLRNKVSTLSKEQAMAGTQRKGKKGLTPYGNTVRVSTSKCSAKRRQLLAEKNRMGRNASISTQAILNSLPDEQQSSKEALINRIQDMFRSPHEHVGYLKSEQFAKDLLKLNKKVKSILEDEPRCVFLQSPAYVFGDIHGNLEDLHFFSDNVWNLGMALTAGNFVFLGDYVDRGMSCLEVVAYLLAMKLMLPQKVFLLRGNHETRDVNGWEEHYGSRSFIYQCRERFGDDLGYKIWEMTNSTFDRMPLAAVIDQDIFCVHGGIPRPISDSSVEGGRIKDILNISKVAGINPPYEHEEDEYQQVASDCIWSDPASEDQEQRSVDKRTGYGDSLRGGGAICFGAKAVTNFLAQQGFSYIMRAHEAHAEGVAVSKGARVFTVFSTSKDHNQGNNAMAGCILIDFEKMQVINRSPAYRNQYVHRRDSVSLAMLSEAEIKERIQLGLIEGHTAADEEEEFEEEEWEEFDEDDDDLNTSREDQMDSSVDDEEEYTFDDRRKSSVDPSTTTTSPPGSSHDNHEFDVEAAGMPAKKIDFGGADDSAVSGRRRSKRDKGQFLTIAEDDEDEESTVNGDDEDDAMEPFDDSENYEPGSSQSTSMSPALKKFSL